MLPTRVRSMAIAGERIEALTALRGLAALAVLIVHSLTATFGGADGIGPSLLPRRGYLAVDLFFVLSGFVLMHVYGDTFSKGFTVERYAGFLWARIARIYPVHLFAILLLLRFYGMNGDYSGWSLVMSLLLLNGPWLDHGSWNGFSWSVSAEWHAYLLFPLIVLLGRRRFLFFTICPAMLIALAALSGWRFDGATLTYGLPVLGRSLPEFALGVAVYHLYAVGWARDIWRSDRTFVVVCSLIVVLAMLWPTDIMIILLFPVLLLASASNGGRARSVLELKPLVFLGDISYSLYMTHYIWMLTVFGLLANAPKTVQFAACIAFSLIMATFVSRRVEWPARAFLRRLVWPAREAASLA